MLQVWRWSRSKAKLWTCAGWYSSGILYKPLPALVWRSLTQNTNFSRLRRPYLGVETNILVSANYFTERIRKFHENCCDKNTFEKFRKNYTTIFVKHFPEKCRLLWQRNFVKINKISYFRESWWKAFSFQPYPCIFIYIQNVKNNITPLMYRACEYWRQLIAFSYIFKVQNKNV
jgi:hypothetical protein